jgi:branched-chain amino acid transport system ATP-binding protein
MIEHDIDIALALADKVTVLHRGKLIFDGLPDEVQRNADVKEVYFGRL